VVSTPGTAALPKHARAIYHVASLLGEDPGRGLLQQPSLVMRQQQQQQAGQKGLCCLTAFAGASRPAAAHHTAANPEDRHAYVC
jgi:hypothetical protein